MPRKYSTNSLEFKQKSDHTKVSELPTMENHSHKKILFILLHFFAFGCCFMNGVEWNCASTSNTGTFKRSTDCTISGSDHVNVTNTLEIIGTSTDINNLITITAATNKRHFYLNHGNAILILLKLIIILPKLLYCMVNMVQVLCQTIF